jgi:hypothetical protein
MASIIQTNGKIEFYQRKTRRVAATMARFVGTSKFYMVSCQEYLTDFSEIENRLKDVIAWKNWPARSF